MVHTKFARLPQQYVGIPMEIVRWYMEFREFVLNVRHTPRQITEQFIQLSPVHDTNFEDNDPIGVWIHRHEAQHLRNCLELLQLREGLEERVKLILKQDVAKAQKDKASMEDDEKYGDFVELKYGNRLLARL